MAVMKSAPTGTHLKIFAIGEKEFSKAPPQSCILEFYAQGGADFTPYYYAPLAYDPITLQQEIADDVITMDNYVIFATRDTRENHAKVNLRISDTTSVLLNGDIDNQWRFLLPSYYNLCSELRLHHLKDEYFTLSYIIHNEQDGKTLLCIHKINLYDFLAEYNTIVYGEVELEEGYTNLIDVIYEPDVNTMVLLLNGNGNSRFYHLDPFFVDVTVSWMEYSDCELYSIDTIGFYLPTNMDMYVAHGGDRFFSQDISNGIYVENSCLDVNYQELLLPDPPKVKKIEDPVSRYSGNKDYILYQYPCEAFYGQRDCGIIGTE